MPTSVSETDLPFIVLDSTASRRPDGISTYSHGVACTQTKLLFSVQAYIYKIVFSNYVVGSGDFFLAVMPGSRETNCQSNLIIS